MQDEIYADGIGEITVTGPIVRIDFVSLSPKHRDAQNNPTPVFRQRVIMSIEAFANAAELMRKALTGLAESGAIAAVPLPARRNDAAGGRKDGDNVTNAEFPSAARNSSPNFS